MWSVFSSSGKLGMREGARVDFSIYANILTPRLWFLLVSGLSTLAMHPVEVVVVQGASAGNSIVAMCHSANT